MEKRMIDDRELTNKKLGVQEDASFKIIENSKYIPKDGDIMWYINPRGMIETNRFIKNVKGCLWLVKHHLVFKTEEECKGYKRYLELLDRYMAEPEWYSKEQEKWHIFWDHYNNVIRYGVCYSNQYTDKHFDAEGLAMDFVEEVGESNIKKFMLGIWE